MSPILKKDTQLSFPHFMLVSASAGSGKTYSLAWRIVQILLSESIPHNAPRNLLALTFTNNAAAEMKQRVLAFLKQLALGDAEKLREAKELLDLPARDIRAKASRLITEILDNYSSFHIRTLDSFLTNIFRISSLEFGVNPSFEIVFQNEPLIREAFDICSRDFASEVSTHEPFFRDIVRAYLELRKSNDAFVWDPLSKFITEIIRLDMTLSYYAGEVIVEDVSSELQKTSEAYLRTFEAYYHEAENSGCELRSNFENYRDKLLRNGIDAIVSLTLPLNALKKGKTKADVYERASERLSPFAVQLSTLLEHYVELNARQQIYPFLQTYRFMQKYLDVVKKEKNQIYIQDITKRLAMQIAREFIPMIYLKLGETFYHYLLDEFQDTAPVQWEALNPLIAEALATDGSLFIVGDTKQSIYGFRGADWHIMKSIDAASYPSAAFYHASLPMNFRSGEAIIQSVQEVFEKQVPAHDLTPYAEASGLLLVQQEPKRDNVGRGFTNILALEKDEEQPQEKEALYAILDACTLERNYSYGDIAVLALENDVITSVSGWLNEKEIPFLSHSSLDIRKRKVIGEILALIRFLDSPLDDLAFATFLLSDVLKENISRSDFPELDFDCHSFLLDHRMAQESRPMYKHFQQAQPKLWEFLFEPLFQSVGFLSPYNLLCAILRHFHLFEIAPKEEAALTRLLEVFHETEQHGIQSLKEFFQATDDIDDNALWRMSIPDNSGAITLMTVHKSKGLDFPIVLLLLYDKRPIFPPYYIDRRESGITLLKINSDTAAKSSSLENIYEEAKASQTTDSLNKLYVALTRAKKELHVLAIHKQNKDLAFPTKLFPQATFGAPEAKSEDVVSTGASTITSFHAPAIRSKSYHVKRRSYSVENIRGSIVHAALRSIMYLDDNLEEQIDAALAVPALRNDAPPTTHRMEEDDIRARTRETLLRFLRSDEVQPLFRRAENREVTTEQEFIDSNGHLFRCDRIIIDPREVCVIDFKTGATQAESQYEQQMRRYIEHLKNIFPECHVHGVIAYVDACTIRSMG